METILFQGDSITDTGRSREDHDWLGRGYVTMIGGRVMFETAPGEVRIFNRGISGNRTCDLLTRWQADCIDLQPTILSLYIGVNNTWRRYDSDDPTSADVFASELDQLLASAFSQTPAVPERSILIEPFVLGTEENSKAHWIEEDLAAKQAIVREAAQHFGTLFLPLQSLFDAALASAPASFWAPDGVHPSTAGHGLIAQNWLDIMSPVLA